MPPRILADANGAAAFQGSGSLSSGDHVCDFSRQMADYGSPPMNPTPPTLVGLAASRGTVLTTQWSIIVHAGSGSESQAPPALETLGRQYSRSAT